jgi:hypothetical protein
MTTTKINAATPIAANLSTAVLKGLRRATPLLLAGLLLSACSATEDVNRAQEASAHFHEMMSAGQFDDIYSQSDEAWNKAVTAEQSIRFLSVLNRKLGVVKNSQSMGWNAGYGTSGGESVTLRYTTQFEHGAGVETFVYRFADGKALLAGYNINSNELLVAN